MEDKERNTDEISEELGKEVKERTDIGNFTVKLEEVIQSTCSEISGHKYPANSKLKGKTEKIKIMSKRTKALR